MRLKRPNCFSVRQLEFEVAIQMRVFSNTGNNYDMEISRCLKVCLSKVHSIDFHDKRIKPMSLQIETDKKKILIICL